MIMLTRCLCAALCGLMLIAPKAMAQDEQGKYFAKKKYVHAPLPAHEALQHQLPSPIYDEDTLLVRTYWKAWQLACTHFYEPAEGTGYVSQFIDAAFNANIFLWDTSFMTMFCRYAAGLVPGIGSLDNFYAKQHEDGEICREINRSTGVDFAPWRNLENKPLFTRWGFNEADTNTTSTIPYIGRTAPAKNPYCTLDALDNPMLSWAELESYRMTNDRARLKLVIDPLVHYYRALQTYLRQGNGLYVTDWASMDNSPRNIFLKGGGQGVDISAQMVMFARDLAEISRIIGRTAEAKKFEREADELSGTINEKMWNKDKRFYYDLTADGKQAPVKTIAAYWTLLSRTASGDQARALAGDLTNPKTFGRVNPVPTVSADEPDYHGEGGYWKGAVWVPTNTMVIRGLERNGYDSLAREIAMKHVRCVAKVFDETGTIWENYAPDSLAPGRHAGSGTLVMKDFVGWSGIGPIMYFLEYAVGLKADAPANTLVWTIRSGKRSGCERFRFNNHVVSLIAEPGAAGASIRVTSDGAFTLQVSYHGAAKRVQVKKGETRIALAG
jgi:hypothetical protein